MTTQEIETSPLTAADFAPFGDVIEGAGPASFAINGGMCDRFHDLARVDVVGPDARLGISVGVSRPFALPLTLTMVERHPLGSQAFVPMTDDTFVVIVAPDEGGSPGEPRAFMTNGTQGVNYLRDVWHGVLTPIGRTARFLIIDRVGPGENLEEHVYGTPWTVHASPAG